MNDVLREKVRVAAGREATPSAGSIDSQSIKTSKKGALEAGMAEKDQWAQAALIVDALGLVLRAFVTEANYTDREVASWLIPLLPHVSRASRSCGLTVFIEGQNSLPTCT